MRANVKTKRRNVESRKLKLCAFERKAKRNDAIKTNEKIDLFATNIASDVTRHKTVTSTFCEMYRGWVLDE